MRKLMTWTFLAVVSLALGCTSRAQADYYIPHNMGGILGLFQKEIQTIQKSGQLVRVGAECYSACTLILQLPRWQVCVEPGASFGFHAAWTAVGNARQFSLPGTRLMLHRYPADIRDWIGHHGGLGPNIIVLEGRNLHRLVQSCPPRTGEHPIIALQDVEGLLPAALAAVSSKPLSLPPTPLPPERPNAAK